MDIKQIVTAAVTQPTRGVDDGKSREPERNFGAILTETLNKGRMRGKTDDRVAIERAESRRNRQPETVDTAACADQSAAAAQAITAQAVTTPESVQETQGTVSFNAQVQAIFIPMAEAGMTETIPTEAVVHVPEAAPYISHTASAAADLAQGSEVWEDGDEAPVLKEINVSSGKTGNALLETAPQEAAPRQITPQQMTASDVVSPQAAQQEAVPQEATEKESASQEATAQKTAVREAVLQQTASREAELQQAPVVQKNAAPETVQATREAQPAIVTGKPEADTQQDDTEPQGTASEQKRSFTGPVETKAHIESVVSGAIDRAIQTLPGYTVLSKLADTPPAQQVQGEKITVQGDIADPGSMTQLYAGTTGGTRISYHIEEIISEAPDTEEAEQLRPVFEMVRQDRSSEVIFDKVQPKEESRRADTLSKMVEIETLKHLEQGKMEFRMQLQPENLGKIDVKMILESGKLAVLIVSSARTNELLARQVEALAATLRTNQEYTSVQVVTQAAGDSQANLHNALNGQRGDGYGSSDGQMGQKQNDGKSPEEDAPEAAPQLIHTGLRQLNYSV